MNIREFGLVLIVLLLLAPIAMAQDVLFSSENSFAPGDDVGTDGAYRDTYQVRVQAGTTIEVICRGDGIDTYIEAILPGGMTVSNDDYEGFNAGFMRTIGTSGTMEFSVSPLFSGEEGDYKITVTELGEARQISVGEVVRGVLGKQSSGRRAERYEFQGQAGQRVVVDLESDDFDTYLQVVDASGQAFTNDDGGDGFNSRLGYSFDAPGSITIVASSLSGDEAGNFELRVAEAAGSVVDEYRGTLTASDTRGYDGRILDVYEYSGSAGTQIGVSLESNDFDAIVYISNPDGSNLGQDDDGGGNGNSRLDVTLPMTGTYKIYVTSFFDAIGEYRLTIFE